MLPEVATASTVLVRDVKKVYPGGKFAVKGVSMGIPNGEVFGLLGINGAVSRVSTDMRDNRTDRHGYV